MNKICTKMKCVPLYNMKRWVRTDVSEIGDNTIQVIVSVNGNYGYQFERTTYYKKVMNGLAQYAVDTAYVDNDGVRNVMDWEDCILACGFGTIEDKQLTDLFVLPEITTLAKLVA